MRHGRRKHRRIRPGLIALWWESILRRGNRHRLRRGRETPEAQHARLETWSECRWAAPDGVRSAIGVLPVRSARPGRSRSWLRASWSRGLQIAAVPQALLFLA